MFGDILRIEREKLGLSQSQLGERLKVSRKTVSRWENNEREPRQSELAKIHVVLGISPDALVGNPTEAPVRRRRTTGASTHSAA